MREGIGFSQVVIGLSGGVDSSVTAVMAVDAFGAKNVHGVLLGPTRLVIPSMMPHLGGKPRHQSHTVSIASRLRHSSRSFASPTRESSRVWLPRTLHAGAAAWYSHGPHRDANRWMLMNTGNKSEAAMGYSATLRRYGGRVCPTSAAAPKTDVYGWAVGATSRRARQVTSSPFPRTCSY